MGGRGAPQVLDVLLDLLPGPDRILGQQLAEALDLRGDPRPVDLLGHRPRRGAEAVESLIELSEPSLSRPNLVTQPWRRLLSLRHEVDEGRKAALGPPPPPAPRPMRARQRAGPPLPPRTEAAGFRRRALALPPLLNQGQDLRRRRAVE